MKFKYLDKVLIERGFYGNLNGRTVGVQTLQIPDSDCIYTTEYLVRLNFANNPEIWINESNLKSIEGVNNGQNK